MNYFRFVVTNENKHKDKHRKNDTENVFSANRFWVLQMFFIFAIVKKKKKRLTQLRESDVSHIFYVTNENVMRDVFTRTYKIPIATFPR